MDGIIHRHGKLYKKVEISDIKLSLNRFYLGEIYRQTDRPGRTKECFFYALELESTRPIQPFTILPRFV